ncbi:MAG: hypothetical protein KAS65_00615 [Candidatus Aminicenantes bacterium]|nr:hypothetical protein [Candidatus Aminicenantes bacterium]
MKKIILILFVFRFSSLIFSTQPILLPELLRPAKIEVGDDQIYIIEDATIYVYSLETLMLKTKFGKKGEGPGEFPIGRHFNINMINIIPQKDKVIVNSRNKIIFFNKDGRFLSEKKTVQGFGSRILPFGNNYIGSQFTGFRQSEPAMAINIYDKDLNKLKEIFKVPVNFGGMMGRSNRKINEFSSVFGYDTGNSRIYLFYSQDFLIDVLNSNGDNETSIKVDYRPVHISSDLKAKIMDYYENVRYRNNWERVKNRIELPDRFPAIQSIKVRDGKIYVQTYKSKNGKCEFYIFNKAHKLEERVMAPLKKVNVREYFPYCIKNSKIYQVVEDEEGEDWHLLINDI